MSYLDVHGSLYASSDRWEVGFAVVNYRTQRSSVGNIALRAVDFSTLTLEVSYEGVMISVL